jgi:molybdopterin synthase sulfur carrier subunit
MVRVRLPSALRSYAGGAPALDVEGETIGDVLDELDRRFPAVGRRVLDEQGRVRRHVHVYIGDKPMRGSGDLVPAGVEVSVLPAVSGGASDP